MTERNAREHLRDFYEAHDLDAERLDAWIARIEQGAQPSPGASPSRAAQPAVRVEPARARRSLGWVAAAALLAAVDVLGPGLIETRDAARTADLGPRVAREIAHNHHKRLDVEHEARTYEELGTRMDKLDFTPVEPERLARAGFRLTGARYCSIQGRLAAQIRVRDAAGRTHTLYETRLAGALADLTAQEHVADGVRVRLWREAGLLMGLASPPEGER